MTALLGLLSAAQVMTAEPLPEVVAAMRAAGDRPARMIDRVATPSVRFARSSKYLTPGATDGPMFWVKRILRPEYQPSSASEWRGARYPDLDVLRYDKSLPNGEKLRVVDLIGAMGFYLRHQPTAPLTTPDAVKDHLLATIFRLTKHPNPQETNIGTYFSRVDLPSGRPLWYGTITLGEVLASPQTGQTSRNILTPVEWFREFMFFTDGRGTYIRPPLRDSTLPRATSGAKTPGGDGGRRILRF